MKQISDNFFGNNRSYFPQVRLRRLRKNKAIRDLLQETRISLNDLIYPLFVEEGLKNPKNIPSMPDIQRIPLSKIVDVVSDILDLGIKGIVIFGIPIKKDNNATSAYSEKGIVQKSIKTIKKNFGDKIVIISDVCMCQYTSTGHCGIVKDNTVDNDSSINILAKIAESHAAAGSDIVAPSAMMDGQVLAIRERLDETGFNDTSIMGYSAKMASPLYSPFRDLADSSPLFGDRKTYQMPITNLLEALREIELDINEGADIIMVKPALPYLDLICKARENFKLPLCAYSVSGEYALIKAAAEKGWVNEAQVMLEFLSSIKRAGADIIITYHAREMAKLLLEEK
ncbi:MAG TPA: porphobilinogen synthase [Nitrososphaeraceae archaeon]|nr:porphobilinogen synthase [Nitrososphaeraceae archaeon]